VLAAARHGARTIALVDGVLAQELTVSPSELREVAGLGVRLWGAASLGAIRAVECPRHVEGVGEVFEMFLDGTLCDDDEVVGTFDTSFRALAPPMVVWRDWVRVLILRGALTDERGRAILGGLKALAFDARTPTAARKIAEGLVGRSAATALDTLRTGRYRDIKRRDCARLFDAMHAEGG